MKRKQVWRYYCEFCGKSNCSAASIGKHEKHCTANPNRVCRLCSLSGGKQRPMSELIAAIGKAVPTEDKPNGVYDISELRRVTENCPACILAAIRQSGLNEGQYKTTGDDEIGFSSERENPEFEFDFKKEMTEFMQDVNNAAYQAEMRACHGEF